MLRYALIFFVVALIAGVLGFGGIADGAFDIARIIFAVFMILFIGAAIAYLVRGKTSTH